MAVRDSRRDRRFLIFHGVPGAVRLDSCAELLGPLGAVLGAWPVSDGDPDAAPLLSIGRHGPRYRVAMAGRKADIFASAASALCRVAADLVSAFVDADPRLLCLHSGAAAIGGRLVVFPSTYRAGKSTLLGGLAAAGVTVHADDVLPLDEDGLGMSLAVAPRLRLPLPPQADDALRGFAERHAGPSDDRYLYLSLPPDIAPRFGARLPIGDFVLLERGEGVEARLLPAAPEDMLAALVGRNFAEGQGAPAVLSRLGRVVRGRGCFRLVYDRLDDAVDLIRREFSGAHAPRLSARGRASGPAVRRQPLPRVPADLRYRRRGDVAGETLGDAWFLADPVGGAIARLDGLAAGIWRLLEQAMSVEEATQIVAAAFPRESRRRLSRDVGRLFDGMAEAGMIVPDAKNAPDRVRGARNTRVASRVSRI